MARCARLWSTLLLQPRVAGPECAQYETILGARDDVSFNEVWNHPNMQQLRRENILESSDVCRGCINATLDEGFITTSST